MRQFDAFIKWSLLVCGLLTGSMFQAAFAPQTVLEKTFGSTLDGPVAEIVVRNWGALIGLGGLMLIYAAFRPASRPLALTVVCASKLVFITLVLVHGRSFLSGQAGLFVAVDSAMVILFALFLFAGGRGTTTAGFRGAKTRTEPRSRS